MSSVKLFVAGGTYVTKSAPFLLILKYLIGRQPSETGTVQEITTFERAAIEVLWGNKGGEVTSPTIIAP